MAYRFACGVTAVCVGAFALKQGRDVYTEKRGTVLYAQSKAKEGEPKQKPLPSRSELISSLKETPEFDILVIGGGATGCGVALDAVTRGLKTALVEKDDYSSGSSSRSTKLIHGGVRYLQKAIMGLDREQYHLVAEALHERANLLAVAPHLSAPLPIMLPVYKWWQVPYFWVGIKAYDIVSGRQLLKWSYFVGKKKALELFPMLKKENLCGAIIYYDGQHNDSRMNLAIGLTAVKNGAACANHCEVVSLLKKKVTEDGAEKEVICGAHVRDVMSGEEFDVNAKCVINATGPFTDTIRTMDDSVKSKICQPSSGVHIVLPDYYSPRNVGLLDPATSDGRVIFFLPWEGKTIAGTTDAPTDLSDNPLPTEKDIQFILGEVKHYLSPDVQVRRGDVLAAWSGIRPLVLDPKSKNTESLARNHIIDISEGNLLTIAGGKWTTYRSMAQETVDAAVKHFNLQPEKPKSQTDGLMLDGGEGFQQNMYIQLVQEYGLEVEVAQHLAHTYGSKAPQVAEIAALTGSRWPIVGRRLDDEFPYIEADVKFACREYACTITDILARRLRIAFLNVRTAQSVIPRVAEIMAKELSWSKERTQEEIKNAKEFLDGMGLKADTDIRDVQVDLTDVETEHYTSLFKHFDVNRKDCITAAGLKTLLEKSGEKVSEEQLRQVIEEVAVDNKDKIELNDFLQLMCALKTGAVVNSRFGMIVEKQSQQLQDTQAL